MNTNRQQKENVMLQTVWELPCLQKFYPKQSNTSLFCSLMMKIMNCHGNQCIIVRHRLGIYKHTSIESSQRRWLGSDHSTSLIIFLLRSGTLGMLPGALWALLFSSLSEAFSIFPRLSLAAVYTGLGKCLCL